MRYSRFYRLIPIAQEFANGYAALINDQGWQKVTVISTMDDFTKRVSDNCMQLLPGRKLFVFHIYQ